MKLEVYNTFDNKEKAFADVLIEILAELKKLNKEVE